MGIGIISVIFMLFLIGKGERPIKEHIEVKKVTVEEKIQKKVKSMTLDEKIGQLFVPEASSDDVANAYNIKKYHLGGMLLMGNAYMGDRAQFKAKIKQFQKNAQIPLTISTDQEGGLVSRLSYNPAISKRSYYPSPQEAYQTGGMKNVKYWYSQTAIDLKSLGINWNFAPIADVSLDPNNYIFGRTIGKGYKGTGDYIKDVIPEIQKHNVAASLKHFPGYGTAANTHVGSATSYKSVAQYEKEDFVPFKDGIKAGADSIMVTHIIMSKVDPYVPASLSKKDIDLLRKELHFKGVIVSDSLQMGAVSDYVALTGISRDVTAFRAGNDVLLSDDFVQGIPEIKQAITDKQISMKRLDKSVERILMMKHKIGLKVY
ncbi:glycosyl hydrolase family 3, N terminal domain containing protein [Pediococcus claussenii ATCC BAA-344]|uniref:beta-N-acetylhexosaminidase n=2 Tax=Pediococcus claussenii TaxID=187452 RepID=G8PEE5_PEDCP|nr:glycosyl hydrolase family 3, N terminal domain containing protein [Pediococcus claussenii ATCC BAA-344]